MTPRQAAEQAMRDALRNYSRQSNPFSDWFADSSTSTPAAEPVNWERAIAGGFAGVASARGYTLQVSRGGGDVVNFDWRDRRGSILRGAVRGKRSPRLFLGILAKLAEWEPELMHWRAAFAELGLFKTERSTT